MSSQNIVSLNALNFTPDNKHCYAYSGAYDNSTSAVTILDFTTNSEYIEGQFTFNGPVRQPSAGSPSPGATVAFSLKINEVNVGVYKVNTTDNDQPNQNFQQIIFPPFSRITVDVRSLEDGGGELSTVLFTGKAYGMKDTGFQ
jgi:hypothetical protein